MKNFKTLTLGTLPYVYQHGLRQLKKGKQPSAILWLSVNEEPIKNPKAAFAIAKLLMNDSYNTLLGKPFLRTEIDWAEKYKEHLAGPNRDIPYGPTSGIDKCLCTVCFYRDAPPKHNPKNDCQIGRKGNIAKKFFGYPVKAVLPMKIEGKEVAWFCPHWLPLDAD